MTFGPLFPWSESRLPVGSLHITVARSHTLATWEGWLCIAAGWSILLLSAALASDRFRDSPLGIGYVIAGLLGGLAALWASLSPSAASTLPVGNLTTASLPASWGSAAGAAVAVLGGFLLIGYREPRR